MFSTAYHKQRYIFSLRKTYLVSPEQEKQLRRRYIRTYAIAYFKEGTGAITIDDKHFKIDGNQLFLLAPGMIIEGMMASMVAYFLFFNVGIAKKDNQSMVIKTCDDVGIFKAGAISIHGSAEAEHFIKEIHRANNSIGALAEWRKQLTLEQLIYALISELKEEKSMDSGQIVENVLQYLNKHYTDNINLSSLAETNGLSPSVFSRMFKRAIGISPSDYITQLRIKRAKKMLYTSAKIKEVAEKTGYCDEFYFSRTFKRVVGVSPTVYIKSRGKSTSVTNGIETDLQEEKIAVTYIDEIDHLISLGKVPIAIPQDPYEKNVDGTAFYLNNYLKNTMKLGSSNEIDRFKLFKSNPDMIIAGAFINDWGIRDLDKIAPTYYYNWVVDWRTIHRKIAKLFGREDVAARNIDNYNKKIIELRSRLNKELAKKKFVFLECTQWGIRVSPYTSNGGWLLFNQLGLTPSPEVPEVNWEYYVRPEELALIKADYIFMGRRSNSEFVYKQLIEKSKVDRSKIYEVSRYPWAKGGPMAFSQGIDQLASFLIK